jgi:CO/xanthine dehydrogenase Mo-binding subunit
MRLERPLKWTEDRQENFYATTQERGQVHEAEMALSKDGRILGVRDWFLCDTGAYDPYGLTIPHQHPVHAAGAVRHPELRHRVHVGLHEQADRDAGARARAGSTASS